MDLLQMPSKSGAPRNTVTLLLCFSHSTQQVGGSSWCWREGERGLAALLLSPEEAICLPPVAVLISQHTK